MPYTSWGWMTGPEVEEILADMDMGSITVYTDDKPEWFVAPPQCPVCGEGPDQHDSYWIVRASGEIYGCVGEQIGGGR